MCNEEFKNAVVRRLDALGVSVDAEDAGLLGFCMEKVWATARLECNREDIPAELEPFLVDMAAGEFLFEQKATGRLALDPAVRAVAMGDTSVTYTEPFATADRLIAALRNCGSAQFARIRRLPW